MSNCLGGGFIDAVMTNVKMHLIQAGGGETCEHVRDVLSCGLEYERLAAEQLQCRASEIKRHIEKYATKRSTRRPSKSVAESWRRIKAWLVDNVHYPLILNPGASSETIADFERIIQMKLPN